MSKSTQYRTAIQQEDLELNDNNIFDDDETADFYEHFRVVADPGQKILRVDKFLQSHLSDTSRNRIQQAARAGYIHVNDVAVKQNYRVKPGDVVTLMLDHPHQESIITPENIPLEVVYEDEELMVVNKPAGMVVHPGVGNPNGTLVNALAYYLRNLPSFDPNNSAVGLVHRIDKDTSGLLLIAKTPDAKHHLGLQFFNKTTRRRYNALVWGNFTEDEGRIEGNIGRDPSARTSMTVFPPDSGIGKNAVTHYRVLQRFGFVTLIECILETGRTHQIRAHMRHIGHPLFNDEQYGGNQILRGERTSSYQAFIHNCFGLCPRQALHARTLGFSHPKTHQEMDFTTSLPNDMQALVEKWQRYTQQKENNI